MNEIGNLILNRRKQLGLTLQDVGDAVGVSKSTVKKWESGDISNMRRDKIEKLAKVLQISPVRLLGVKVQTTVSDETAHSSSYTIPAMGIMLNRLRRNHHITLEDFAKITGIDESNIKSLENGEIFTLKPEEIKNVSDTLHIDSVDLFQIISQALLIDNYTSQGDTSLSELNEKLKDMLMGFNAKYIDTPAFIIDDESLQEIISVYDQLNDDGKRKIYEYAFDLLDNAKYKQ